ncbi:MAG: hypothetical protein JXA09_14650 [Anaerolineae bacterium]|nr:hypothetical protein [Anaerolineae bacterium]
MRRSIRPLVGARWMATLLCLALAMGLPVRAQEAIEILSNEHEHVFRESLTFRLHARATSKITSVKLFYRFTGQRSSNTAEPAFAPGTEVQVEQVEDMASAGKYKPPMIGVQYWWVIETEAGDRAKTEVTSWVYEDTRFSWQVLGDDRLRLYWHDQDQAFGRRYYDIALAAMERLSDEFGVRPKDTIAIVVYNSHEEFLSALEEATSEWTGAVSFGDTGCIAIGLGSRSWMERVIPHELTHATLYAVTKPPFGDIPRWLHEGLAMRSEGGATDRELAALADAIRTDTLISLRALNSGFPDDPERVDLAYAESYSLIAYIIEAHGTEKLGELIAVFAEGAHYDDALAQVFGVDMDGMEDLWRAHIGAPPRSGETRVLPSPSPTAAEEPAPTATSAPVATPPTIVGAPTATAPLPTRTPDLGAAIEATPTPASRSGAPPCLGAAPFVSVVALLYLLVSRARR